MKCPYCSQEMQTVATCTAVGLTEKDVVSIGHEMDRCPDCGVLPGGCHHPGCYVARCSVCSGQVLLCGHEAHDGTKSRWTGEWPGLAECRALGWFCRDEIVEGVKRWHVPCSPDAEGAHPDLNRWAAY